MRIGDLAAQAGVTTKALRFYEQAGVLPPPARTTAGYRDYDEAALARLGFVKAAQAACLTLAEIREVVAVRDAHARRASTSPRCSTGTPPTSTPASPTSRPPASK